MKKNLLILIRQKLNAYFGFLPFVQKGYYFIAGVLLLLFLLKPSLGFGQADGDYRTTKHNGGWNTSGSFEVYSFATDSWVLGTQTGWAPSTAYTVGIQRANGPNLYTVTVAGTSGTILNGGPTGTGTGIIDGGVTWDYASVNPSIYPSPNTNLLIMDGVTQTSNYANIFAKNITVGQGNAFSGTANLAADTVTSVTINNAGALMANPGVTFLGPSSASVPYTLWAARTIYTVGTLKSNGGKMYIVVTAGTSNSAGGPTGNGTNILDGPPAWTAANPVTIGAQRYNLSNIYVATTAGTTGATAPTGTGTVSDGVVTWNYVSAVNPAAWAAGAAISIGNQRYSAGNIYVATSAGTTGATAPTGNGTGISDGVVTWDYVSAVTGLTWNYVGPTAVSAAGYATYKAVGAYYRNKGINYTTATVAFATAWAPNTVYALNAQATNGGNFYNVITAGTSAASGGPTGTGANITDGGVHWSYAGTVPTADATISGGKVTGITITNPGSHINCATPNLPPITITGDGSGASYALQCGVDSIVITAGGNYTVAPTVIVGSGFQISNSGTNGRTLTANGDVAFKRGSSMITGGGTANLTQTLKIGGNLSAVTPISFIEAVPTSTSATNVIFTKAGTDTISGAGAFIFNDLWIGQLGWVKKTAVTVGTQRSYAGNIYVVDTLGTTSNATPPTGNNSSPGTIKDSTVRWHYVGPNTTNLINKGTATVQGYTNFNYITSFNIATPSITGVISQADSTVTIAVPDGTDVTALAPTITLFAGGSISPLSGVAQDFTHPVTYMVTSKDGTVTKHWTVNVTGLSTDANLTALSVAGNTLYPAFNKDTLTYNVALPVGTTVGTLPAVTDTTAAFATAVKTDATAIPGATTIVVTAQDGIATKTYTINFIIGTPQTITMALSDNITYGDADIAIGATASSGLPVTYTSSDLNIATIVSGQLHILAAGTSTITASQAGSATYNPAPDVPQLLTVKKAMLTATVRDTSRARGVANPVFKIDYTGFKGTDNVNSITAQPTASCSATTLSIAGTYAIVVTGGSDVNYDFTRVNGTLTIKSGVGINSIASQKVEVYPNPVGSYLYVSCTNLLQKQTIGIYSINGKQLLITKIDSDLTTIDMGKFAPGVYIIKITTPDSVVIKRITKL